MFCIFYLYDGLFRERKFELLAFVAATVVIVIYVIGNYVYDVAKENRISVIKQVSSILEALVPCLSLRFTS